MRSPCINVCVLDEARGVCRGCGRSLDEIARWSAMADAERDRIMDRLAGRRIDWYFDFVSPYSYLSLHRLKEIPRPIAAQPVLFAGLLAHYGQKGPAEIAVKRRWTYRWCTWWARELGVPFRFPAAHPFNPLPCLRLALACESRMDAVQRIFAYLWTTGEDAADPARFRALCSDLGVREEALASAAVKEALRRNTEAAAARGVFGVPSFVADGEVFWGADAIAFLNAFLEDPSVLRNDEMRRLDKLPVGAARKA